MKNHLNIAFIFGDPFLRRLQWPTLQHFLDAHIGLTVLDIGAGRMRHALKLANPAGRVIAVDLSFRPEDELRARRRGVVPLVADACHLPLPNASVDCILLSSVLHMVATPEELLGECRRVLKPNGHVVMSIPNHYRFMAPILASPIGPALRRWLKVPETEEALVSLLNGRFGVGGPKGYYGRKDLEGLCRQGGFRITAHVNSPGMVGSFLWELGVLAYIRFGHSALHALLPLYPLAWVLDRILPTSSDGEHILRMEPSHEE